ncbi:MAG: hypothetical protein GEU26_07335 [Nitrososphaeraceae archaeon]|nr:hypothetical protein [Nitrososphaeraceae archaeon]
MSPKILAVVFIGGGILIVFALSGFQITKLFSPGITEEVVISVKQGGSCIVEATDRIPREIPNCPYDQGERIIITYKAEQPSVESHGTI